MLFPRASGILLHPTSLPGRYGIGDLGRAAYQFVDYLAAADQSVWQVLPLSPTSYGDSPYQSPSTFAGNPNLISLDSLADDGWLTPDDLRDVPAFPEDKVDYGWIIPFHKDMLTRAYRRFAAGATAEQRVNFDAWCAQNDFWLDDYALFAAIKDENGGVEWVKWPRDLALRDPGAIDAAQDRLKDAIEQVRWEQWTFATQWKALRAYANDKGIRILGDVPIFVAHDSADVWGNRDLFYLDADGNPSVVAGVPPDYFNPEAGQRWGNPLYNWAEIEARGYGWWVQRVRAVLQLVDLVRIDHFRGFEAYWEIPASEPTAKNGRWVPGPGGRFFNILTAALQTTEGLPIVAEDLGVITPGVVALREGINAPGMKILQFAWGDFKGNNPFLPHNYTPNCIVYTGTHDNNTTLGWWNSGEAPDVVKYHFGTYVDRFITDPHWEMIRLGMMSVAHTFIAPMQDILGLGAEARMNTPGVEGGNWAWRLRADVLDDSAPRERLKHFTRLYARAPDQQGGEAPVDAAVRPT